MALVAALLPRVAQAAHRRRGPGDRRCSPRRSSSPTSPMPSRAVFNAFEKMEYPAGTATAIAVGKVALGALVLLPPLNLGFVGLAGVSVRHEPGAGDLALRCCCERKVLPGAARDEQAGRAPVRVGQRRSGRHTPGRGLDWGLQRHMLRESGPLMINHLLATSSGASASSCCAAPPTRRRWASSPPA